MKLFKFFRNFKSSSRSWKESTGNKESRLKIAYSLFNQQYLKEIKVPISDFEFIFLWARYLHFHISLSSGKHIWLRPKCNLPYTQGKEPIHPRGAMTTVQICMPTYCLCDSLLRNTFLLGLTHCKIQQITLLSQVIWALA